MINYFIFSLLYLQFFITYILRMQAPIVTYLITAVIFSYFLGFIFYPRKKFGKSVLIYFLCLCLAVINKSFIIAANIIGYVFITEKNKDISIRSIAGFSIFLNILFIVICGFRILLGYDFMKPYGNKLGKELILYGFHNPNAQALFLFLCTLSIWLFCKNKYFRIIILLVMIYINYTITMGRTYIFASIGMLIADLFVNKKNTRRFLHFLIFIPIFVSIISFAVAFVARSINLIDMGLLGRVLMYGRVIRELTVFKFIFGAKADDIKFPLDGSFFAIFTTMGFFMFVFLLFNYCKYIKRIDVQYSIYIPAIIGLILAGITESSLALFSINTVFLIIVLINSRKKYDSNINHCANI